MREREKQVKGSMCQEEEEELSPQRQKEMSPTKEECVRKTVL